MPKRLSELLAALSQPYELVPLGYSSLNASDDVWVCGIQQDSRRVRPGDLFVAIPGRKTDGHRFIAQARARGAVAVVAERFFSLGPLPEPDLEPDPDPEGPSPNAGASPVAAILVEDARQALAELAAAFYEHPTAKLFTVGVTGTKGKTTTAHLAAAALGPDEALLVSTVTNALERGLEQTTPSAERLQQWASSALKAGKSKLVLEVSAHALDQKRVWAVDFDVAVFTSFSHDHLDYFPDLDAYLSAKLELFRRLKPSATAIVNLDDPAALRVLGASRAGRALTYGLTPKADVWAEPERVQLGLWGTRARVHTPRGSFELALRLPGPFMLENALAAVAVGLAYGLPLPLIKARLERVERVSGRLELYRARGGFTVAVDFAHSPASLERVLLFLRRFHPRVITVFGCGGDSDKLKRPLMGAISGRLSAYTIVTNDNPKDEDPLEILREIERGLQRAKAPYEAIPDRRAAIRRALELARPGDCVLIAGKGHERVQLFRDRAVPFNDADYLKELGAVQEG